MNEGSVDIITVGQALHWFDLTKARKEFSRVMRKGGHVCVVYNQRSSDESTMLEYGEIVRLHATKEIPINAYVPPNGLLGSSYSEFEVPNKQRLDFDGLVGRAVSASNSPDYRDDGFLGLERDLKKLFDKRQIGGSITLHYVTIIFIGQITN